MYVYRVCGGYRISPDFVLELGKARDRALGRDDAWKHFDHLLGLGQWTQDNSKGEKSSAALLHKASLPYPSGVGANLEHVIGQDAPKPGAFRRVIQSIVSYLQ